jgi:lysophospholipase L1-like esterase
LISAEQIIAAHQQIIARAKARGLCVLGGTLSPAGNSGLPGYFGPEAEAKRQQVNQWIRTSGAYDKVVDFDRLLRDPDDPTVMRADLSADGLHPNTEGYRVMAKAVYQALVGLLDH